MHSISRTFANTSSRRLGGLPRRRWVPRSFHLPLVASAVSRQPWQRRARRLVPTGRPRTSTFAPVVRDDDSVSPLSRARESLTSVNRRIRRGLSRRCSSAQSSSVYPSLSRRDAPAGARTRTSGGEWCSHARSVAGVRATRLDAIPQRRRELSCRLQKSWDRHAHAVYPYGKQYLYEKGGC